MPDQVTFSVQRREVRGHAVRRLRSQGILPGNICVPHHESIQVQFNGLEFTRVKAKHPPTTLWRLMIGGAGEQTVLIRHVQHEPVTGAIQHVDFYHVERDQPIRARLPIRLMGEAPAVRMYNAVVLTLTDSVEVEARPADLPEALTLDISGMEHLKDTLYVRDLKAPNGVRVLTDPDEPVVKMEPPTLQVEEAPLVPTEEAAPATGGTAEAGSETQA